MGAVTSTCLRCQLPVSVELDVSEIVELRCGHCGARQRQMIYPAFSRPPEAAAAAEEREDNATCYFHESSRAENLCGDCGRYLCALCTLDIPMPANLPPDFPEQVCPACFENRMEDEIKNQRWDLFRTSYTRYDVIAVFLVLGPVIIFPLAIFSFFTIPAALYVLIRYWRVCRTPVKHSREGLLLALVVVLFGVVAWVSVIGGAVIGALE